MRQIGVLSDEAHAQRFVRYLAGQGIDALAEPSDEGWAIWVREEDHRQKAQDELAQFLVEPDHPRYRHTSAPAASSSRAAVQSWPWPLKRRKAARPARAAIPLTRLLIALTLTVSIAGWFGRLPVDSLGGSIYRELRFVSPTAGSVSGWEAFVSIRQGELWRLITPMFLHFDYPHIIFNIVMFYYVASQIERLRGPTRLALLVLLTSLAANTIQAYFQGPDFGGLSGVVYGLLGYVWIKSMVDPDSGFHLDPFTWLVAVTWFLLCVFDVIPNVANHAHAGGLVAGIAAGLIRSNRSASP